MTTFSNQLFRRLVSFRLAVSHKSIINQSSTALYSKESTAWEQASYKYFLPIQTRWSDNDQYGHVNNVIYYSYFDSVVNHYLINRCGLNTDVTKSEIVGFMVDTGCSFRKPLGFPEKILAGLKVEKLGRSSVTYRIAIFGEAKHKASETASTGSPDEQIREVNLGAVSLDDFCSEASAVGHCVHVFVHPETNTPTTLPKIMRTALEKIT